MPEPLIIIGIIAAIVVAITVRSMFPTSDDCLAKGLTAHSIDQIKGPSLVSQGDATALRAE